MRRKVRMMMLAAIGGLGLAAGGCAYHGYGYSYSSGYGCGSGYYKSSHYGPGPGAAVVVGTAALFYAIGSACH
ncbi:MAG: hypothetical protein AAFS11_04380 [Planctomycetota bacterium]